MLESRRDIQDTNTGEQSGFFAVFFSQVIVKEAKNSSHVTTASVSLKLIDMNDNNPLFEKNSYTFYINENSINSTDVGHIMVSNLQHVYSHLRNEYDFWKVHGIMNTSGPLQSK